MTEYNKRIASLRRYLKQHPLELKPVSLIAKNIKEAATLEIVELEQR